MREGTMGRDRRGESPRLCALRCSGAVQQIEQMVEVVADARHRPFLRVHGIPPGGMPPRFGDPGVPRRGFRSVASYHQLRRVRLRPSLPWVNPR